MLTYYFPKLLENKFIEAMRWFFSNIYYIAFMGLVVALSAIFGLEVPMYYVIVIVGLLLPALFADDMTAAIAPSLMGYVTFSVRNNNANYYGNPLFQRTSFKINLVILAILILAIFIARIIFDIKHHKEYRETNFPKYTIGFAALGVVYILAGIFSPYNTYKDAIFGAAQIASLCVLYYVFYYTIDWRKLKKEYFAYVGIAYTLVLLAQEIAFLISIGFTGEVDGYTYAYEMIFGWGVQTNIGGIALMFIPAPFYLMTRKEKPWIYVIFSVISVVVCILPAARAPMLLACLFYIILLIITLLLVEKKRKIEIGITVGSIALLGVIGIIVFWNHGPSAIFHHLLDTFDKSSSVSDFSAGRLEYAKNGWNLFKKSPIFGAGWYSCEADVLGFHNTSFMPARYHNTIIQVMASCGVVGLIALIYNRFEIYRDFFTHKVTAQKIYLLATILTLLIASLLDNHLFNIGPGLIYGAYLVMLEKANMSEEQEKAISLKRKAA